MDSADITMSSSEAMALQGAHAPFRSKLRRLPLAWSAVLAVALIDFVWTVWGGWSLLGRERLILVILGSGCLLPLLLFKRYRSDVRVRSTVLAVLLLIAFSLVASVLSYLVVSAGAPLVDSTFARWDSAIGFNWLDTTYWVNEHPPIKHAFGIAYGSGLIQIGFVVLFLGLAGRGRQLNEFVELYVAGLLLAIACSLVFPAAGPWINAPAQMPFDASVLSHFVPLHVGLTRVIDLDHAQGLISMPSVHAMVAIFIVYAMRGTGLLFPPIFALNTLMLMSTPTAGGHYLVDVIGGGFCAAALIWTHRRLA